VAPKLRYTSRQPYFPADESTPAKRQMFEVYVDPSLRIAWRLLMYSSGVLDAHIYNRTSFPVASRIKTISISSFDFY